MPAVNFYVTWPDGEEVIYYSPSTIIHEHIKANTKYSIAEFQQKIDFAMAAASERVRAKYGFACSAASGEQEKIQQKIERLKSDNISGQVFVAALT